ncbi:MAG: DUF6074 family protein [Pseudomonadota bacterium]
MARRRDLVLRQAAWFAEQGARAAEVNLSRQLKIQRDVMVRRGIAVEAIELQLSRLETAIRSEATRLRLTGGGR